MLLKISTATTVTIGPVLDADGAAVTTAVVTNLSLSKNGSSAALTTETLTHVANGYYTLALTSGNTNTLGNLEVFVNNTAMSMTVFRYNIIAAQVYDSIVSGSDLLQVDVREMLANVITSGTLDATATAEIADAVLEESILDHRNVAHSLAKYIYQIKQATLTIDGIVSTAITPTTLTFSSNVAATTSAYAHAVLLFISGPLAGENSPIISYTSTNGVFVLEEPLTAAPSDGDEFVVIAGSHVHAIADIQAGLATSSGVTSAFTEIKGAGWSASTDTLEKISDATGTTVNVAPFSATLPQRVQGTRIDVFYKEAMTITVAVFDESNDPVDLTTQGNLRVAIERRDGTDLQVVENAGITISGTDSNQFTFTCDATATGTLGQHYWSLRRTTNNEVLAHGQWQVLPAAFDN